MMWSWTLAGRLLKYGNASPSMISPLQEASGTYKRVRSQTIAQVRDLEQQAGASTDPAATAAGTTSPNSGTINAIHCVSKVLH